MVAFRWFYEVSRGVPETSYTPVSKIQKRINEPQIGLPTEKETGFLFFFQRFIRPSGDLDRQIITASQS